jgi:hypothetical protein
VDKTTDVIGALQKLDKLISEIENEDSSDSVRACWVIIEDLKNIRRLLRALD